MSTGIGETRFAYVANQFEVQVALTRRGYHSESDAERYRVFNALYAKRHQIARDFGASLDWDRGTGMNWHIAAMLDVGGYADETRWQPIQVEMIRQMKRLQEALQPHLDEIDRKVRQGKPRPKPTFNTPYRRANEQHSSAERIPFAVDPNLVDRALASHARLQNRLCDLAEDRGFRPLSSGGPDPDFDIAWKQGAQIVVVECKSITDANESKQLRLGLGQLLDYEHHARTTGKRIRAVLAIERRPRSDEWVELCKRHGVKLAWPGTFNSIFK